MGQRVIGGMIGTSMSMYVDTLNLICLHCNWKLVLTSGTAFPDGATVRCEKCAYQPWYSESKFPPFMFSEREWKHLLLVKHIYDKAHARRFANGEEDVNAY